MATKGKTGTVTPSGGGLGNLGQILGGLAATGGGSGSPSLSGSAGVNLNTQVYVPTVPGTTIGMHWSTIQGYINGLSPADLMAWEPLLVGTGYASTTDPTALRSALANVLYDGSQTPNAFNAKGVDPTTYLNDLYNAQQSAAPAGPARAYKGGTASVSVTPAATVQAVGDAVAQQLLGRHIRADEVQAITASLNSQEYAKGSADIQTAQAQQEAMNVAFSQGMNVPNAAMPSGVGGWAKIPNWQIQQLQSLSAQGQLSGVDPKVMAAIVQAESGGQGGGVNSEGYGGFFGLSKSNANLTDSSPTGFAAQAQTAAATFANLLRSNGGDVYAAEQEYQTGSPQGHGEGVQVMQNLGIAQQAAHVTPLQPGQQETSETVGQTTAVKRGNETYVQLPPTATVYQTPQTTDQAAASYFMNNEPTQYQTQNLVNVFSTIQKMMGGGAATGNPQGPLQAPLNMP